MALHMLCHYTSVRTDLLRAWVTSKSLIPLIVTVVTYVTYIYIYSCAPTHNYKIPRLQRTQGLQFQ